jgi:hypothetical protein
VPQPVEFAGIVAGPDEQIEIGESQCYKHKSVQDERNVELFGILLALTVRWCLLAWSGNGWTGQWAMMCQVHGWAPVAGH